MATQTQTIQRTAIQRSRVHDYIYDPVYTVSSEKDHARATLKAQTNASKIKRVPVYETMFSELPHQPRFEYRLDTVDPVPRFISRQWRGHQREAQGIASLQGSTQYEDPQVTGASRYKYFRRPLIPYTQSIGPDVVYATARQDPLLSALTSDQDQQRDMTPFMKVAQTQTDYRDSDVQTDPYTPDYVVRPGSQPELLTLALLSYGRGLPAGLAEVEMIERARAKRAWEACLPELHDAENREKRRKMMEEQEVNEWALREREIEKLQEARLEVLMKLLRQREEQHDDLNSKRLDRVWVRKQEEMKGRVERIHADHVRSIRKMIERKRNPEGKFERRDIIEHYGNFGSQTYAPLTRVGVFIDRNADQFVVKSKYISNYYGLLELERSLPDFVMKPVVKPPKQQMTTSAGFLKRKYREEKKLADIYEALQDEKRKLGQPPEPLRFLQKVDKVVPRPATPTVIVPSEEEEQKELAVIVLQRMLRGRSLQNMMYEGKEKRSELIHELRSTHALQDAEKQMLREEKEALLNLQKQQELYEHKENYVDEMMNSLEGECLGDMLDFLNKELIRLQEERRIHAFSLLAERQRRIREAEESGQRQEEERRRREHDEIFKQTVKVHQSTVDGYLESIIFATVDQTAESQARQEIQQKAEIINDAAYAAEERRTRGQTEEIVGELVFGFLIPEVQKQTVRQKVRQQQHKFLLAAHNEIYSNADELESTALAMSKLSTDQPQTEVKPTSSTRHVSDSDHSDSEIVSANRSHQCTARGASTDKPHSRPESKASSTNHPQSRPESKTSVVHQSQSRPGSQASVAEQPTSRPGSKASVTEQPTSRPGSKASVADQPTSRPGSKASVTDQPTSRPGSKASVAEQPTSRPGSKASVAEQPTSRPGSSMSVTGQSVKQRSGSVKSVNGVNDSEEAHAKDAHSVEDDGQEEEQV